MTLIGWLGHKSQLKQTNNGNFMSFIVLFLTYSDSASSPEKMKEEKEAIDKLVSDLPTEEEDYLDITLTEEAAFLQEYKTLLNSMMSWMVILYMCS